VVLQHETPLNFIRIQGYQFLERDSNNFGTFLGILRVKGIDLKDIGFVAG
jgi:hypothetical protein